MMRAIKYLMKWAKGNAVDDTGEFRVVQVNGAAKDSIIANMAMYGFTHHPPEGSLYLVMQVNGDESNRVAIADFPQIRFGPLKGGEVAVYSIHGQYLHMKENGDIDIYSPHDINIRAENLIRLDVGLTDKKAPGMTRQVMEPHQIRIWTPDYEANPS